MNRFPIYVPIILLIFVLILFVLFIVVSKLNNSYLNKEKMFFRNHFSFEYFYANTNVTLYLRIILGVLCAFLIASTCLFVACFRMDSKSTFVFAIFICVIFFFAIINAFLTFTIKTSNLTMFKLYATLLFLLNALANGILGIIMMNSIFENAAYKILGGLLLFNLLVNIILMVNPKLKDWDKLEENINSNNEKIYVRPKIMHLALSMWISYLTLVISVIYMIVGIIMISAGI